MKKILLLAFAATAFIGCTRDAENALDFPDTKAGEPAGEVIPVEKALAEMNAVLDLLPGTTRSGERRSIHTIAVSGGSATRSTGVSLPDTMVYVVNFENESGFAVLGARRTLDPVYVLTESGSFDAAKLNRAITFYQDQLLNGQPATRAAETDNGTFGELGIDYVYEMVGASLAAEGLMSLPPISGFPGDAATVTYGPWNTESQAGPYVTVKWNQTYPFNMSMPADAYWNNTEYNGKYPVGCGVIAMAQILSCTQKPAAAPAGSASYNWMYMNFVSNYLNVSNYLPFRYTPSGTVFDTYTQQLSEVLNYLGISFNRIFQSHQCGVSATEIIKALKKFDPAYYAKANYTSVDVQGILAMLDAQKPVYVVGNNEKGEGHAWVVDGYIHANREETSSTGIPGINMVTTKKYYLYHINWGFSGSHDGYFISNIFDSSKREFKDDTIDKNTVTLYNPISFPLSNNAIYY